MTKKKVMATRLDPEHIAKAIDGLKLKGYEADKLDTISNIIRLVFFHGLAALLEDVTRPASRESQTWVSQKIGQKQTKSSVSLKDIIT